MKLFPCGRWSGAQPPHVPGGITWLSRDYSSCPWTACRAVSELARQLAWRQHTYAPLSHTQPITQHYNRPTWSRITSVLHSIHTIAIVHLSLLRVGQDVVCCLYVLKLQKQNKIVSVRYLSFLFILSPFLHHFLPCPGDTVWPAGDRPAGNRFSFTLTDNHSTVTLTFLISESVAFLLTPNTP